MWLIPSGAGRGYEERERGCARGWSELYEQAGIESHAREVVGHGVAVALGVGDPVVGVHVVDVEEVEGVETEPYVAEVALPTMPDGTLFVVDKAVTHTYIYTSVGRGAEDDPVGT